MLNFNKLYTRTRSIASFTRSITQSYTNTYPSISSFTRSITQSYTNTYPSISSFTPFIRSYNRSIAPMAAEATSQPQSRVHYALDDFAHNLYAKYTPTMINDTFGAWNAAQEELVGDTLRIMIWGIGAGEAQHFRDDNMRNTFYNYPEWAGLIAYNRKVAVNIFHDNSMALWRQLERFTFYERHPEYRERIKALIVRDTKYKTVDQFMLGMQFIFFFVTQKKKYYL